MLFDAERLRALAKARQAEDEEIAAREFAQFESERFAAFSEWLSAQLDGKANEGEQSASLALEKRNIYNSLRATIVNEPAAYVSDSHYAYLRGSGEPYGPFYWLGPSELPIDRVRECVIELMRKAGLSATLAGVVDVEISW